MLAATSTNSSSIFSDMVWIYFYRKWFSKKEWFNKQKIEATAKKKVSKNLPTKWWPFVLYRGGCLKEVKTMLKHDLKRSVSFRCLHSFRRERRKHTSRHTDIVKCNENGFLQAALTRIECWIGCCLFVLPPSVPSIHQHTLDRCFWSAPHHIKHAYEYIYV